MSGEGPPGRTAALEKGRKRDRKLCRTAPSFVNKGSRYDSEVHQTLHLAARPPRAGTTGPSVTGCGTTAADSPPIVATVPQSICCNAANDLPRVPDPAARAF